MYYKESATIANSANKTFTTRGIEEVWKHQIAVEANGATAGTATIKTKPRGMSSFQNAQTIDISSPAPLILDEAVDAIDVAISGLVGATDAEVTIIGA